MATDVGVDVTSFSEMNELFRDGSKLVGIARNRREVSEERLHENRRGESISHVKLKLEDVGSKRIRPESRINIGIRNHLVSDLVAENFGNVRRSSITIRGAGNNKRVLDFVREIGRRRR